MANLKALLPFFIADAPPAPPADADITRTVTSGFHSDSKLSIVGWWDLNIGSISDRNVTFPDGTAAVWRQCMRAAGGTEIPSALADGGLRILFNAATESQFPDRVRITRGTNVATYIKNTTTNPNIQMFGQGVGRAYTLQTGVTEDVLVNNQDSIVQLFYD